MKQYIQNSIYGLLFCSLISCEAEHINLFLGGEDSEQITISVSVPGVDIETRAEDTQIESALNHLDLLIFDNNENNIAVQRITQSLSSPNGTIKLSQKRSDFKENADYSIYVIANSNTNLNDVKTLNDLKVKIQTDENIHLSGLSGNDIPSNFLMDGCVFNDELFENEPEQAGTIKLGNKDLNLKVVLRRAAAKVIVTLNKGKDISFIDNNQKGYYFKNIAKQTTLLKDVLGTFVHNDKIIPATEFTNSAHLEQLEEKTTIIGYMYSHSWDNTSTPTMVVNIPLQHNNKEHANSYYELKLTEGTEFKRNTCYMVNATINAPGAENESTPTQLNAIEYSTMDWENDINVNVGGVSQPTYLKVNQNELNMYNIATDATTLKFTSSSPIEITVKETYYIDKFGAKKTIDYDTYNISGTTLDGALSGNITVNSNIPTNNTIRYFTLVITNQTRDVEEVVVKQYPLVYVTNQVGYYSYREDFIAKDQSDATTYENLSSNNNVIGVSYNSNGTYSYETSIGGFFISKVNRETYTIGNNQGKSDIDYYYCSYGKKYQNAQDPGNARMYHIRIMSSSNTYKVGKPLLDSKGYTASGTDNAKLVSPSFMIASRLGFISSNGGQSYANTNEKRVALYNHHCSNYVETYINENGETIHLKDWRLPTAEELKIIIELQGTSSTNQADAIDYLLNAGYYISASGPVRNEKYGSNLSSTYAARCVRDAY